MTESHSTDSHADSHLKAYLVIFGALSFFTLISFVVYEALGRGSHAAFVIILGVAVCKAALVGAYFMHLVMDWRKVYIMIVPALVLGPMMMIVLLPDIVLSKLELVPPPPAVQHPAQPH